MTISILSLFPEVFKDIFSSSIVGRAQKKGLVNIRLIDIRDYACDKHKSVDDKPYGGGVGMIMRVDVVERAIEKSKIPFGPSLLREFTPRSSGRGQNPKSKIKEKIVLLDPTGKLFTQATARRYSHLDHLILVCGHYEGIDARISHFVDETVSIGKYILTGGEIAAMVITDTTTRLIPVVLAKKEAVLDESFSRRNFLEAPQYTRPRVFQNHKVPQILLSGDHNAIAAWKKNQAAKRSEDSPS